ncbi:MAG: serine hydrolase, partial [Simkaniaceae bacterium]|nr:serine hydrolase [Simkaniaceae bacterium]
MEEIKDLIRTFKEEHQVEGMAVGIISKDNHSFESSRKQILTYGDLSKRSVFSINDHTEFRIGQLTKIFTSTILAHFVHEGKIQLRDPISKYLPRSVQVPSFHGKEITFLDLATHTSGLPNISYDLSKQSTFTLKNLYTFLGRYHLSRYPGEKYEYSNVGYALLSNVLTRIAKDTYANLAEEIVINPLKLEDTSSRLSKEQKRRFATGYLKKRAFP